MNLTSPILKSAAHAADLPGDSVTAFLKTVADSTGPWTDDSPDRWFGMAMSGLAGAAAALAVAIILTVYFRTDIAARAISSGTASPLSRMMTAVAV